VALSGKAAPENFGPFSRNPRRAKPAGIKAIDRPCHA
jgi:hypothetical protein